jgi:hypothetical protein
VSGALHKETLYGVNLDPNGQVIKKKTKAKTYIRYVVRKPLLSLSKKELENIVDDEIRESIKSAIKACALKDGLDVTQDRDFAKITKELFKEGFRHPTGHTVMKKVRVYVDAEENIKVRELSHRAGKHAYAQSEIRHHTALYRMPDGKLEADMVSLWEATKRKRLKQPLYAPTFEGGELITTFVNKELLFFTKGLSPEQVEQLLAQFDPKDKSTYHVLFPYIYRFKTAASTSKQMAFLYHSLAKETVKTVKKPKGDLLRKTATPSSFRGFKLIVDPLGYVTEIIEIKR